ncbi:MAG: hypothetical protein ACETVZ_07145 [Phycisphaerae bacterium]
MDKGHFRERRGGKDRRKNVIERRGGKDRRQNVVDRRLGLDLRRGPGRRLTVARKSAEEGQMSDEQFEFLMAIQEYKSKNAKPFPTWTEVLEVIKALGYRKVAEPQPLKQSKKDSAVRRPVDKRDKPSSAAKRAQKQAQVTK